MSTVLNIIGALVIWLGYGIPIASIFDDCLNKNFRIKQNCDWTYTGYVRVIRFWGWWWLPLVMTDNFHEIAVHNGKYDKYTEVLELIQSHYGIDAKIHIILWNSRKSKKLTTM
jgi:hypothetical protein